METTQWQMLRVVLATGGTDVKHIVISQIKWYAVCATSLLWLNIASSENTFTGVVSLLLFTIRNICQTFPFYLSVYDKIS